MYQIRRLRTALGLALVTFACAWPAAAQTSETSEALLRMARVRVSDHERAPRWFKRLLRRPVGWYFTRGTGDPRVRLLADSIRVFKHFERDDTSGQFDGFVREQLAPFVASLSPDPVREPRRRRWSLETLVINQMVGFLAKSRDFSRRTLGLITGKHLKGASATAAMAVGWSVAYHFFPNATWGSTMFVGGFVGLALIGPFNAVTTEAAGFFVRPTTELIKTMGSRVTGDLEAAINRGYDWLVAKLPAKGDSEHNDTVRVATFEEEHTDFAGMSPEDQLKNWARGLNIFIMVQNIFGRLLRDTHHGGRDLMMLSWTDSQNISQLVETLDVKEHVLRGLEQAVLAPYRHAMIARGDVAAKDGLDRRARHFNDLIERVWIHPDMDQGELDRLATEIQVASDELREYGLSDAELAELMNLQRVRGRAVGKLITAVSVGHLRQFYGAERNRNLARDAHAIAHAIQVGFGTEEYNERYLPLVRRQMRLMGMEYSDDDPPSPVIDPTIVARERCLIARLRDELTLPAGAKPETYACINALIGYDAHVDLLQDPASGTARLFKTLKSHGAKLEAGGIIKYARTMLANDNELQARVGAAVAACR